MTLTEPQRHEFKQVKRRLSAIQKMIKTDLTDGQLPQQRDVADFIDTSEEMARLCIPQWRAAMGDYMQRLERFRTATSSGDLQAVRDGFQGLMESKVACHKAFRSAKS